MFDRLEWGLVPSLGKALGWKPPENKGYGGLDWRGFGKKEVEKLAGVPDLFRFMVQVATVQAVGVSYHRVDELVEVAKEIGIDPKALEKEIRAGFAKKTPEKKAAARKAKKK
jgi:hypothetical protein